MSNKTTIIEITEETYCITSNVKEEETNKLIRKFYFDWLSRRKEE